ncbi:MAG: hypothetical protein ABI112_13385 [Terracoccus sp.]
MPVTELDTTSWTSFESTLALRLGQLGDHEFVSIAEGSFVPEPHQKRGRFGRMFGGEEPVDAGAFVQAQRTEQLVYVECVGSRSFGGRHAWTPQQEAELERVGWVHRPELIGDKVYVMGAGADPDMNGHVPVGDARAVAALMVVTMHDVVGIVGPASLDVTLG